MSSEILELKALNPQEWESLIDDYHHGGPRRRHWLTSGYSSSPLLHLSLSSYPKLPLSLKLPLLIFLEEEVRTGIGTGTGTSEFPISSFIQVFRSEENVVLKNQLLVTMTCVFLTSQEQNYSGLSRLSSGLVGMVNELLDVINRPNHGPDRQSRGVACECLRELEVAFPGLLSAVAGPLWGLCLAERTHVVQQYVLLLTRIVYNVVMLRPSGTSLNRNGHLVPFSLPGNSITSDGIPERMEVRRAVSFLLECPSFLTSFGVLEFVSMMVPVCVAMELQASLLKVQFSGLLYVADPLLCHAYLMVFLSYADEFRGQEDEIICRLALISRETQSNLVFRLLGLHWLLGFVGKNGKEKVGKVVSRLYPSVFDPLALKALKIDLLAYCSMFSSELLVVEQEELLVGKFFEDGIVSVSGFKWLPSWSTETAVVFRAFHKFLIGTSSHDGLDPSSTRTLMQSPIFKTIQRLVIDQTVQYKGLVPVHVSFIDRLLGCDKHRWLGERLLQTFDEHLLPKVKKDCQRLPSYFPIFERIAENDTIPPGGLIELLIHFVTFLVAKHGPDTELRTWSRGSKVIGICRLMLMHHHSSRLFLGLSRLLAFTCLYFPDIEVRDNARIYLRMLLCIPGKKLRHILISEDQLPGVTPASQSNSYFNVQSQPFPDLRKSKTVSSYIHLLRVIPLLIKQSWSLSLPTFHDGDKPAFHDSIRDSVPLIEPIEDAEQDNSNNMQIDLATDRIEYPPEPLRVMDSKVAEIVGSLRRHFSTIPDFRHMAGFKIKIPCDLCFESEPFSHVWGSDVPPINSTEGAGPLPPAMYAVVLKFSSSAPYGPIPSQRIPFLLGEPDTKDHPATKSLDIVPVGGALIEERSNYKARAFVVLEPREPVPGLVDVSIEANTEDGQIIHGQLQALNVGIEDMFLKPTIPSDVLEDERPIYNLNLFKALWEACGSSSNIAHETFPLKGGKGIAAISGTRSVKFIEVPVTYLIECIEQYLAPFVVSVVGEPLVDIVKDGEKIKDVIWKDSPSDSLIDDAVSNTNPHRGPLYLKYTEEDEERGNQAYVKKKRNMGCFRILIFLPPRFHLLLQMEVSDISTLVRIRTDHWPCLAYIDDYLEALFS